MFPPKIVPSPSPCNTVPRAKPSHHPKRYLNQFSRFCMGSKCYDVQCIVNGELNPKSCPFPLGFRKHAGGLPSHGHRQYAQKSGKDHACDTGDICDQPRET